MGALPLQPQRRPLRNAGIALGAALVVAALLGAAVADRAPMMLLAGLTVALWAAVSHRWALQWRVLTVTLVLVILFVPIGRYALPGSLPFQLEPYRVLVAAVAIGWVACLLIQPWTRYRPTGFGAPVAAISVALLLSVGTHAGRIHGLTLEAEVIKGLTFFVSFFVVLMVVANTIASRRDLDTVLKALVGGGAVVALLTVVETHTGFTPFNSLDRVLPFLQFEAGNLPDNLEQRGTGVRAVASAQHPIALGALLALLVPLGVYLARRWHSRLWWVATGALALGVLTTVARTATLMLVVEVLVMICLKPRAMLRLWPWAVPFLIVVHIAVPGTLGSIKEAFFPKGGLIAEQQYGAGTYGSNRLADLGPGLEEWKQTPYFGQGFGTRITESTNPKWNSPILDNQWLGWLLETGLVGALGLLWLFVRAVRRFGRAARRDSGHDGWLLASLAASVAAFGIGMATFDAFAFTQVVILLFVVLGLGSAAVRLQSERPAAAA